MSRWRKLKFWEKKPQKMILNWWVSLNLILFSLVYGFLTWPFFEVVNFWLQTTVSFYLVVSLEMPMNWLDQLFDKWSSINVLERGQHKELNQIFTSLILSAGMVFLSTFFVKVRMMYNKSNAYWCLHFLELLKVDWKHGGRFCQRIDSLKYNFCYLFYFGCYNFRVTARKQDIS